jgi:hypothetical protein
MRSILSGPELTRMLALAAGTWSRKYYYSEMRHGDLGQVRRTGRLRR